MQTTFTNGRIAISKDLIFGLCAFVEYEGEEPAWFPMEHMTWEEFQECIRLLDHNPTFPWKEEMAALHRKMAEKAKEGA